MRGSIVALALAISSTAAHASDENLNAYLHCWITTARTIELPADFAQRIDAADRAIKRAWSACQPELKAARATNNPADVKATAEYLQNLYLGGAFPGGQ
jgi:hypothetical protein